MNWISDILGGGFQGIGEGISKILSSFGVENATDKNRIALEVQKLIAQKSKDSSEQIMREMSAKERVLVAELNQGDNYTKRARPTVVYAGLLVVIINNIILPWIAYFFGMQIPKIEIPGIFWTGWSGIVMTWSIGRTVEKNKRKGA